MKKHVVLYICFIIKFCKEAYDVLWELFHILSF